ncbi:Uncharacterized protein dnm_004860 [Desulfonema magnum]|uniref:Uncharacterized protein n=1 Tax=Desulfonema magnum TaxID=45655 RepID=A0A975BFZ3_9BACT|nr:Uncharacterized protein dnm_004860 [Desulfonema magnum]
MNHRLTQITFRRLKKISAINEKIPSKSTSGTATVAMSKCVAGQL